MVNTIGCTIIYGIAYFLYYNHNNHPLSNLIKLMFHIVNYPLSKANGISGLLYLNHLQIILSIFTSNNYRFKRRHIHNY